MTNYYVYGETKVDAVRALKDGLPSCLSPSNPYKGLAEAHRWGEHYDRCPKTCPALELSDYEQVITANP